MQPVNFNLNSYWGEPSIGAWASKKYQAYAYQVDGAIRLTIRRVDEKDGIGWDDLQKIKNECGFRNKDGVEFYPSEEDVFNCGNWRHLHIFDEKLNLIKRA
jgi:hypothetical protein